MNSKFKIPVWVYLLAFSLFMGFFTGFDALNSDNLRRLSGVLTILAFMLPYSVVFAFLIYYADIKGNQKLDSNATFGQTLIALLSVLFILTVLFVHIPPLVEHSKVYQKYGSLATVISDEQLQVIWHQQTVFMWCFHMFVLLVAILRTIDLKKQKKITKRNVAVLWGKMILLIVARWILWIATVIAAISVFKVM